MNEKNYFYKEREGNRMKKIMLSYVLYYFYLLDVVPKQEKYNNQKE